MTKSDEYREKAEYCQQMAAKVISPIDRESWLKLAADWLLMLRLGSKSNLDK